LHIVLNSITSFVNSLFVVLHVAVKGSYIGLLYMVDEVMYYSFLLYNLFLYVLIINAVAMFTAWLCSKAINWLDIMGVTRI